VLSIDKEIVSLDILKHKDISTFFMLSTGRAGSGTLAHLLQQSEMTKAFHVPAPELIEESFKVQQKSTYDRTVFIEKVQTIVKSVGESGLIYAETNPRLSFFVKELDQVFNAKFLWVIRDPYEYVNSGINRGWYTGKGGIWDENRERPVDGWPAGWGQVEKIAWQWACINSHIEQQLAGMTNVKVVHFSDIKTNPTVLLDVLRWAGISDISLSDINEVFGLKINVGKYSAPRDAVTGDHIFGEKNRSKTRQNSFNKYLVSKIFSAFWDSLHSRRYIQQPNKSLLRKKIWEPKNYLQWIRLLKKYDAEFCEYSELTTKSDKLRVFLRHDIDLYDEKLMNQCRDLELGAGVRSTWFFLPPNDKRYVESAKPEAICKYIQSLKADGFHVGYHVNAWENSGSYDLVSNPLDRLDYDIGWFNEVLEEPLAVAVAHGIPHHKEKVSNFSMFDDLAGRNILMLDQFIIHDKSTGKPIPHFSCRSRNPFLGTDISITYVSDSGGPVRIDWEDLGDEFISGNNIVINTHCANYTVLRKLRYTSAKKYHQRYMQSITRLNPYLNKIRSYIKI
jgi:hypothetical protein